MHVYGQITGTLSSPATISGQLTIPSAILPESYQGQITVTPSQSEQVLQTNGFYMRDNITIEPIPNNYGLITWDGSTLTVS